MMGLRNYCWDWACYVTAGGILLWRVYTCPGGSRPDNEISESSMSPVYKLHCMQFYSGDFIYEYSLWRLKAVFTLLLLKDWVLHISWFFFKL